MCVFTHPEGRGMAYFAVLASLSARLGGIQPHLPPPWMEVIIARASVEQYLLPVICIYAEVPKFLVTFNVIDLIISRSQGGDFNILDP